MIKKKLWVMAGAVAVSSVAVIPAITAQAYPADTPLAVSATFTGTGNAYVIKVTNADPHCTVRLLIGSVKQDFAVDSDGTVRTQPIDIGAKTGARVIYAKTIAGTGTCEHKETATTQVVTTTYTLGTDKGPGDASATVGEKITIKALGWDPRSKVTIAIYNDQDDADPGAPGFRQTSRTPNTSGNVFWKVKTPPAGIWIVIATQGTGPDLKFRRFVLTVQPKTEH